MIQVIGQCVETGNEAGARNLFDVLETLLILVCSSLDLDTAQALLLMQAVHRKSLCLARSSPISLNSSFVVVATALMKPTSEFSH